jgi:hypothetical protein
MSSRIMSHGSEVGIRTGYGLDDSGVLGLTRFKNVQFSIGPDRI